MKSVAVSMGFLLSLQALLIYINPFNLPIPPFTRVMVCLTITASILYFIAIAYLESNVIVHIIGGVIAAVIVCLMVSNVTQIPFFSYIFFLYASLVFFNSLLFLIVFSIFKEDE